MTGTFTVIVLDDVDGRPRASFAELTLADLPDHDVLVSVEYSSLNYKDGLAVSGRQKIARRPPLIAGADLADTVVESRDPVWAPGDRVLVNGWGCQRCSRAGARATIFRLSRKCLTAASSNPAMARTCLSTRSRNTRRSSTSW